MDMTRDALKWIAEQAAPNVVEINEERYTDKSLERIEKDLRAKTLEMHTLSSLVDYIRAGVDEIKGRMLLHVVSPERVELISCLDRDRKRETIAAASAMIPDFAYGRFYDHEEFLIALQAKFVKNADRELLLKFAGTVEKGTVAQYGDDGVTQKATVKSGISSKTDALVPNPVFLTPYRTFTEVEQPGSAFIFRMRDDQSGVKCAVFEADGGAWRYEAVENIADYLTNALEGCDITKELYTVIY